MYSRINDHLDSPQDIVNVLANFFKSVHATASSDHSLYNPNKTSNSQNISATNISQLEVTNALRKMKNTKTAVHDKIPFTNYRPISILSKFWLCNLYPKQFILSGKVPDIDCSKWQLKKTS